MRSAVVFALLLAAGPVVALAALAAEDATYRLPPKAIADILVSPSTPRGAPNVSPDGSRLLLPDLPALMPIADLAEPVEKLAGLEVLQGWYCTRSQIKGAMIGFSIATLADGKRVAARLPKGARIGAVAWSPAGDRIACTLYARGGAELWIVTAATGAASRVEGVRLQSVLMPMLAWANDGRSLMCATVPAGVPGEAALDRVPSGPRVRVGAGKPTPQRTSRDVLRTEADQRRFREVVSTQLVRVDLPAAAGGAGAGATRSGSTGIRPIGDAAVLYSVRVSPDERHLAVESGSTFPIGFPAYLFPRDLDIWSADGRPLATVGSSPLDDRSAISSVERLGPRQPTWSPDGSALWFLSWEDRAGADFARAIRDTSQPVPGTDRLFRFEAPFTGSITLVAICEQPMVEMAWAADGRVLVVRDRYEPRRVERMWWIDPAKPIARTMLHRRSTESAYGHPGTPLRREALQQKNLWTTPDGGSIYLAGDGFGPKGPRPFLDRMELSTGRTTRLFESGLDVFENVGALLAADGSRFVTLRQTGRVPPNYFLRAGSAEPKPLSDYPHPAAALAGIQRIPFSFTRPDSVKLNAEAVLPAGWKPGQRLPTIFWVYPNDYRSATAAAEVRRSPNRFPSKSPLNPEVLLTQGYALVYPDLAIVGTNDRYVEDLVLSAKAAVDEAVRRGFTDRERIGVGGHSYGAFSTANLLAHTDLFRAGIASDGAYNRTLTPFTFQSEERNLWEARDTYLKMSPFLSADRIRAPLLLLHNLDDTNVGTHPIQSDRMFEALNGLGKNVTLVEYPYEDHGPASRETVLDYWARVTEWFDRYVKNAKPASAAMGSPPVP